MPTRIGGPVISGFNPRLKTWADMRSPLVLNGSGWNGSYSEYSRQWPPSLGPIPSGGPSWTSYKYFKWNSGSLFRHDSKRAGESAVAFIGCFSQEESFDPPHPSYTYLLIGDFGPQNVDNNDFLQLVGEPIDIDLGTFIINADAHSTTTGSQFLTEDVGTTPFRQIYAIGKLTGF
jgi:hypothetical protein